MKHYRLVSDALIDGAKLREQCHCGVEDEEGRTCAFGAIRHAMTGDPWQMIDFSPEQQALLDSREVCPVAECRFNFPTPLPVANTIVHLNDDHKWTREQIAGWLATIEEKLGMVEILSEESSHSIAESVSLSGESAIASR